MIIRFTLLLVVMFVSCKSLPTEKKLHKDKINTEEKTIYYYFQAKKRADTIGITLQKKKSTHSKLKGSFTNKITTNQYIVNHWLVSFISNKDTIQIQVNNPLNEEVEYINEKDVFEKRIIHHNEKEFVLRIPYLNSIKSITFEAINVKNGVLTTKKINTIQL